jgi:NTE family protein
LNEQPTTDEVAATPVTGKTGLALSGGGYRAMLFHVGALWRLNELGWLNRIDRISSVSGGSIAAGRLAAHWDDLKIDPATGVARDFDKAFVQPLLRMAGQPRLLALDVWASVIGALPFVGPGLVTSLAYRRHVSGNKGLQDLPDHPEFYFNASHFASATNWRFTKAFIGTYRLGRIFEQKVSIAQAIAASAGYQTFLSPLTLHPKPDAYNRDRGADLYDDESLRKNVVLTDGGVYDNLGLQPLAGRQFTTLLVSDASGGLSIKGGSYWFPVSQVMRALDTATVQARGLRRTMAIDWVNDAAHPERKLGMWRTLTDVTSYEDPPRKPSPFDVHEDWRFYMANIRTRLNHFSEEERSRLVNWGYICCDVIMRNYVLDTPPAPAALPYATYNFENAPGISSADIAAALNEVEGTTPEEGV